jgi:hypothetical protein
VDRLSKTLRIVFAPLLMREHEQANREFQWRPVTITRRADHADMPVHTGRRMGGLRGRRYVCRPLNNNDE